MVGGAVQLGRDLSAEGNRFGIIVSRFNESVTRGLLTGALSELERLGALKEDLTVVWVPGSFELPWAARRLAGQGFDALICLGALIQGETDHYHYLAAAVSQGISRVSLDCDVPIAFGVLTARTVEQARDRSRADADNKGTEAAAAAVEMAQLARRFPSSERASEGAATPR